MQKSRATGFMLNSEYGSDLSFVNCCTALSRAIMLPPIAIAIQKPGELVGSILSRWDFCIWLRRTQFIRLEPKRREVLELIALEPNEVRILEL